VSLLTAYLKSNGVPISFEGENYIVLWFDDIKIFKSASGRDIQQVAFIQYDSDSGLELEENDIVILSGASYPVIWVKDVDGLGKNQFKMAGLSQKMI
jgi:hypothetical protein